MRTHLCTELVLEALEMALAQRRPDDDVHHSDHGRQYTSIAFGARCREAGVRPSMGTAGDCFDRNLPSPEAILDKPGCKDVMVSAVGKALGATAPTARA